MPTAKQRAAARKNIRRAQQAAASKQTLKHLPAKTRTALGKEAAAVRRVDVPTREELEDPARRLNIRGRSKMGKDELRRALSRAPAERSRRSPLSGVILRPADSVESAGGIAAHNAPAPFA
jgi:hypothetical protein